MKPACCLFVALLVFIEGPAFAKCIEVGDSADTVVANLGAPAAQARIGNSTLFYFPFGEVVLLNQTVVAYQFRSTNTEADMKATNDERKADGERVKSVMLSDPKFLVTPYAYQLHFWREFQTKFPDVAVREQITTALTQYHREILAQYAVVDDDRIMQQLEINVAVAERLAVHARDEGIDSREFPYPWPSWEIRYGSLYAGLPLRFPLLSEHHLQSLPAAHLVPLVPRQEEERRIPPAPTFLAPTPESMRIPDTLSGSVPRGPSGSVTPLPSAPLVPLIPRMSQSLNQQTN